jgi:pyridoxamine 5'-phosphate oxidase
LPPAADPQFAQPLDESKVDPDPFVEFAAWFAQAGRAGIRVPEAAALATASAEGVPSVRMVLVKEAGEAGFVFYSNFESRKGRELEGNPRAALLFHWDVLGRQVRIEGEARRLEADESAAYIRARPRSSQLSALVSPQSRTVASRAWLEQRVAELAARYQDAALPLPENWGGFRVLPTSFEFWQHREDRLHDRILYTRSGDGRWRLERLAP